MIPSVSRAANMNAKLSLAASGDSPVTIAERSIVVKMTFIPPNFSDRMPPRRFGKM